MPFGLKEVSAKPDLEKVSAIIDQLAPTNQT